MVSSLFAYIIVWLTQSCGLLWYAACHQSINCLPSDIPLNKNTKVYEKFNIVHHKIKKLQFTPFFFYFFISEFHVFKSHSPFLTLPHFITSLLSINILWFLILLQTNLCCLFFIIRYVIFHWSSWLMKELHSYKNCSSSTRSKQSPIAPWLGMGFCLKILSPCFDFTCFGLVQVFHMLF